mmetsp:Transcript_73126/g.188633  ORF Transcript_73126/g.188633 Transcript_73126/m.188633 type:complete len:219 (+) Transcript_73126:487-1143(+)
MARGERQEHHSGALQGWQGAHRMFLQRLAALHPEKTIRQGGAEDVRSAADRPAHQPRAERRGDTLAGPLCVSACRAPPAHRVLDQLEAFGTESSRAFGAPAQAELSQRPSCKAAEDKADPGPGAVRWRERPGRCARDVAFRRVDDRVRPRGRGGARGRSHLSLREEGQVQDSARSHEEGTQRVRRNGRGVVLPLPHELHAVGEGRPRLLREPRRLPRQ